MDRTNPKDLIGDTKVPHRLVPKVPLAALARVMELGAGKYGPHNWRENDVRLTVYIDAARRHLDYLELGENFDQESKQSHLAHVMACAAIALDAYYSGNLIDDRPPVANGLIHALDAINGGAQQ